MIDRGDIRQAIDRCSKYLGFTAGRWLCRLEHGAGQPDCKIQRSGRLSERLMYEQSHRDYSALLSASSSACHGLLIITVITPLVTKPSATKMPEN